MLDPLRPKYTKKRWKPKYLAKKKKNTRKRLGKDTLNTCAKFQGLTLENGVDFGIRIKLGFYAWTSLYGISLRYHLLTINVQCMRNYAQHRNSWHRVLAPAQHATYAQQEGRNNYLCNYSEALAWRKSPIISPTQTCPWEALYSYASQIDVRFHGLGIQRMWEPFYDVDSTFVGKLSSADGYLHPEVLPNQPLCCYICRNIRRIRTIGRWLIFNVRF